MKFWGYTFYSISGTSPVSCSSVYSSFKFSVWKWGIALLGLTFSYINVCLRASSRHVPVPIRIRIWMNISSITQYLISYSQS